MANDIIRFESISQLHHALGYEKPHHPLITVMDVSKMPGSQDFVGQPVTGNFYSISMKDGSCGMQYGRNYYDFEEGVLTFTAPNQVVTPTSLHEDAQGWMLFFHPDLVRQSNLGQRIDDYTFFSYDVHEALHLSEKEEGILNDCVDKIKYEYEQNIDRHTQGVLSTSLELMLNYCMRFYERQFHTRQSHNTDVVSKVEGLLKQYFKQGMQTESGIPSIQYLADRVNLSANYLSDLLKKETGRNAKEHINTYVIDQAKSLLLNTRRNVSEIAFDLGFNYPHYFSRMFKQKTGLSPQKYREIEMN